MARVGQELMQHTENWYSGAVSAFIELTAFVTNLKIFY
jgi:hypothetical protein